MAAYTWRDKLSPDEWARHDELRALGFITTEELADQMGLALKTAQEFRPLGCPCEPLGRNGPEPAVLLFDPSVVVAWRAWRSKTVAAARTWKMSVDAYVNKFPSRAFAPPGR